MKSTNNSISLIKNGDDFLIQNIDLIKKAKQFILLQTYIFTEDTTTKPIIDAIIEQANLGIKVYILLDGFGSLRISKFENHKNIEFNIFSPLSSLAFKNIGRRLHSKCLIIDNQYALVGGINLSQKFNDPQGSKPWLDYSCLIAGEEVLALYKKILPLYKRIPLDPAYLKITPNQQFSKPILLQTNINDGTRIKSQIHRSYVKAIKNAKKKITIVAPYFLPGKKFLNHLKKASLSGVDVELIFSAQSDHPLERWSSKYLYLWLLSNDIRIFEYNNSIVHGKIAVIDDSWTTIGSYNFNFLSRFSNHEINIEINDFDFTHDIIKELNYIKENSTEISAEKWNMENNIFHRLLEILSYSFANILTLVSMFLFIKKHKEEDINLTE